MSELYNKVKKNVLASKDADAINQLDVMEGKTSNTPFLNKLKKVSRIGKAVAIPIALGTAAFEYAKGKRKEKEFEKDPLAVTTMDSPIRAKQKLSEQGYSDEDISKMGGGMLGAEGMAEGGSVRGQKAIQVKKKIFKGIF